MAIYPVILAGGEGTRLWPLSKKSFPKQFLDPLDEGVSLFQQTVIRSILLSEELPIILGSKAHRFIIEKQLNEIEMGHLEVVLEPLSKNTAASILLASFYVNSKMKGARMAVFPCDHYIEDDNAFVASMIALDKGLKKDELGLVGVKPFRAATEYGYFETSGDATPSPVKRFIEKPAADFAKRLITNDSIYWNSGALVVGVDLVVSLCGIHLPSLSEQVEKAFVGLSEFYGFKLAGDAFMLIEPVSFDVGVTEKVAGIKAVHYLHEWDDLGSWSSVIERRKQRGCSLTFSTKLRPFTVIDEDLLVIEDEELLFVMNKDSVSQLSIAAEELASMGRYDLVNGIGSVRPWGEFKILSSSPGYLVKHLCISASHEISLQSHQSRIEHWVIVSGEGMAEVNGRKVSLKRGDSLTVKAGEVHRLSNVGAESLAVIEVQVGDTLSEADIVRYDDRYQRHLD